MKVIRNNWEQQFTENENTGPNIALQIRSGMYLFFLQDSFTYFCGNMQEKRYCMLSYPKDSHTRTLLIENCMLSKCNIDFFTENSNQIYIITYSGFYKFGNTILSLINLLRVNENMNVYSMYILKPKLLHPTSKFCHSKIRI